MYQLMDIFFNVHCACTMYVIHHRTSPTTHQAYIRRADSLRKALQSGRFEVPANLTYENVITDYCKGHGIKSNVKAFVEAILVAIDNGKCIAMKLLLIICL